jgi:hypothetical protein
VPLLFYHFTERKDDMTLNEELEKAKKSVGRPRLYNSQEELDNAINNYFSNFVYNDAGEIIGKKPSVAGLAFALGFESRQSIYDYAKDGEFSYSIKRALLYFEDYHEASLANTSTTGHIFWLKNHGWKDKTEVDSTVNMKQALVGFDDGNSQSNDTNEV